MLAFILNTAMWLNYSDWCKPVYNCLSTRNPSSNFLSMLFVCSWVCFTQRKLQEQFHLSRKPVSGLFPLTPWQDEHYNDSPDTVEEYGVFVGRQTLHGEWERDWSYKQAQQGISHFQHIFKGFITVSSPRNEHLLTLRPSEM